MVGLILQRIGTWRRAIFAFAVSFGPLDMYIILQIAKGMKRMAIHAHHCLIFRIWQLNHSGCKFGTAYNGKVNHFLGLLSLINNELWCLEDFVICAPLKRIYQ